ncbi:helix-turn-helix transcriptional regulator [Acinetobacter baumannii]|uniref:AraC family transcriptional regulator n=1 Tax=Acinetobacter baumannii TaxID=470 RepID=UPI00234DDC68|nr:helix-turn-helix transcriptional regulator [Acinetobacter baumannii]MDC7429294.1 helix-turn-helix transcriptional regulator [Acinetobacter baumannii]MDC7466699.1 helix-turn-helix transcriptional regulator [Acinetobacter baumannii]
MAKSEGIPTFSKFNGDIYFRHQDLEVADWIEHAHPWGQLNYVSQGIMRLEIAGQRFLSPPHYAVWIPPHMQHKSSNDVLSVYRSVYLSDVFSEKLPKVPCAMSISELLKAILNEFAKINVRLPKTRQELAMSQVALDQIESAQIINAYLPYAKSNFLCEILIEVQSNLRDKLSTQEIAEKFHMTSRTLERKCLVELGIGFGEWQKRARHMRAIEGLNEGLTVQQISWELGYSSPSVFINMFKRLTGMTPERYRKMHHI